jgi:hypothetical protein
VFSFAVITQYGLGFKFADMKSQSCVKKELLKSTFHINFLKISAPIILAVKYS